ncbi:MAG: hypothetical protein ACR2OZ_06220 [Verrucomicrobiales bacterium]
MKTLDEVEPRILITSLPIRITQTGRWGVQNPAFSWSMWDGIQFPAGAIKQVRR